jgi:hypothetical protein
VTPSKEQQQQKKNSEDIKRHCRQQQQQQDSILQQLSTMLSLPVTRSGARASFHFEMQGCCTCTGNGTGLYVSNSMRSACWWYSHAWYWYFVPVSGAVGDTLRRKHLPKGFSKGQARIAADSIQAIRSQTSKPFRTMLWP